MSNFRTRPLALLILALFALPAGAGQRDALHVYGGVAYGHDDNLLRVPEGQPGFDNHLSDSWWTREGGLIFDKTYSRQRISIIAKLSKTDFDYFKQLNYDGKDIQANWFWQLGNHLEGKIGSTYQQVLAPYTDFRSDERNLRTSRSQYAEAAWRFHAAWRVRAGFQRDKYEYELLSQRFNNRTEDASELELGYLARSGNTVGLVARKVKGKYPYGRPINGVLVGSDFDQDELKVRVKYQATGSTGFDALVGYTQRDQPSFGAGKTKGAAGKVRATYQPRGKMTYNAAVWRDFAPLESTLVSYTLNKGASVGAQWDATAKIKVNADAIYERRNYNARREFDGAGDLRDAIRTASLRATWTPRPTIQVSAGVAHQERSGSVVLGTGSFKSNSMTLSANAQF
ncbi:XrtB/PEP-CTERM-associated polysaccharide biosynthesis outer membrane protein EpsL [uncultured Massilia sp.]|uniref:XrtB/PEP-CTERM-associated polysaccharide biosynthesis outer membrane protein EpsL n=1 Tax=uncultured Massilia sp. TaxID=169973 RepID=UPI0025CF8BEF|nr:XrtB/PEP-CTERM-associated polysaccharide biosynthesis outer membrane protein EpsL [uncultured Massilia sp.]